MVLSKRALAAEPTSIAHAREYVRDRLSGILPPPKVWEVELLTTELVMNAVQHAQLKEGDESIHLDVDIEPTKVRVSVTDAGAGFDLAKILREPKGEIGGWGLFLVEKVSDRWGIDETPPHRVWFEVER